MAMVRLAIANRSSLTRRPAMEVERPGLTYTVDTLAELRSMEESSSGRTEMYLILGMDSIRELRRWHEPERLFEMCVVVAVSRPDIEDVTPCSFERDFPAAASRFVQLRGPMLSISATDVRNRVAKGQPIGNSVPPSVERYIRDHWSLPRNVVSWACRSDSCGGVQRMSSQVLG